MALAMLLALTGLPRARAGQALTPSDFAPLAAHCAPDVAVTTLAAIARTESGFEPFAIHDNTSGMSEAVTTIDAAASIASRLIAAGHSVDLGLMQVNSGNLNALGLTVSDAFDACRSIGAGAAILTAGYVGGSTHAQQQAALRVAISRYNTGNAQRGFANGYVRKVEVSAEQVVPEIDIATNGSNPAGAAAIAKMPGPPGIPVAAPRADAASSWLVWPDDNHSGASAKGRPARKEAAEPTAEIMADAGDGMTAAVTYDSNPKTK